MDYTTRASLLSSILLVLNQAGERSWDLDKRGQGVLPCTLPCFGASFLHIYSFPPDGPSSSSNSSLQRAPVTFPPLVLSGQRGYAGYSLPFWNYLAILSLFSVSRRLLCMDFIKGLTFLWLPSGFSQWETSIRFQKIGVGKVRLEYLFLCPSLSSLPLLCWVAFWPLQKAKYSFYQSYSIL